MIMLGHSCLGWCRLCNLAVLDSNTCPKCHKPVDRIDYSNDIRPAFHHDRELLKRTMDSRYGEGCYRSIVPDDRVILLGIDFRADTGYTVFCDGNKIGYLIADRNIWDFRPTPKGMSQMSDSVVHRKVVVDKKGLYFARKRKGVIAPQIIESDPNIIKGDIVLLAGSNGRAYAIGKATEQGSEMSTSDKGIVISDTHPLEEVKVPEKGHSWVKTCKLNRKNVQDAVDESTDFIKNVCKQHKGIPVTVSLSGGKDSLTTLLLTLDAGLKPKVIYANTGMDFNSYPLIKKVTDQYGLELLIYGLPIEVLYRNIERLGPPSVDHRWCCKVHQLAPLIVLGRMLGENSVSFIGQRRYESTKRMRTGSEWTNPFTPGQYSASPVQDWNALHVWMYLTLKKAPYNKMYECGYDRIGCYICPVAYPTCLEVGKDADDTAKKWMECINEYGREKGMPEVWYTEMLWRNRDCSRNMVSLDPEIESDISSKQKLIYHYTMIDNDESSAFSNRELDPVEVGKLLCTVGLEGHMEGNDLVTKDVRLSPDGYIRPLRPMSLAELRKTSDDVFDAATLAHDCLECTSCVHLCPNKALELKDQKIVIDPEKCNGCRVCITACPSILMFRPKS